MVLKTPVCWTAHWFDEQCRLKCQAIEMSVTSFPLIVSSKQFFIKRTGGALVVMSNSTFYHLISGTKGDSAVIFLFNNLSTIVHSCQG